jgi:hypothetical protein
VNSIVQGGSSGGTSPRRAPANKWPANTRRHRELSLAVVLERAHARLRVRTAAAAGNKQANLALVSYARRTCLVSAEVMRPLEAMFNQWRLK